ncbi:MAG: hypothetical protein J0L81_06960 [Caulobacterales bacterium]|jgi:hypothetical protein|nr:hypothetical protein [Caulobacterales bacterium]
MRSFLFVAAALALSACGQTATPPAAPEPQAPVTAAPTNAAEATAQDTCGAAQYAGMVGTPIAAATFPEGVRVITPETMVTQDFRADRLNVIVDTSGNIASFACY